jgi:hypothetical protein
MLLKVANPEPEATLTAKTGANKPRTIAVTNISTLFGPDKTIAKDDKPEIKLKQILQKPRVKKDTAQDRIGWQMGTKIIPKHQQLCQSQYDCHICVSLVFGS